VRNRTAALLCRSHPRVSLAAAAAFLATAGAVLLASPGHPGRAAPTAAAVRQPAYVRHFAEADGGLVYRGWVRYADSQR
jgi:hypothetical protein